MPDPGADPCEGASCVDRREGGGAHPLPCAARQPMHKGARPAVDRAPQDCVASPRTPQSPTNEDRSTQLRSANGRTRDRDDRFCFMRSTTQLDHWVTEPPTNV